MNMKVKQLKREIDLEVKDVLEERKELKQKWLEDNSIWSKLYIEIWEKEIRRELENVN